ncbi:ring-opening amidohydrolase [Pseudohyphozyma bogoriensis]|nr:ring-opening amidohydrolase [Pseudohyphozyma bogoriensis]
MVWDNATPKAVSVFSGGTEGVLTPHVSFVVKESKPTGLLCAVGHTRLFLPEEIGSPTQSEEVCKTVKEMMKSSNLTADDVKLALIKCPLLTSAKMEDIRVRGKTACSKDTYESMGSSRYATAIGIAAALDEIKPSEIPASLSRTDVWSSKASCSSGAELDDCHVFLLATPSYGSAPASSGSLRAVSGYMRDAIDAKAIIELLDKVKADKGKVVQAFVKAEASPDGLIRGQRHTMTTDSDIHSTRHARAAVGGLLAGLTGDTCIYMAS